MKHFIKLKDIPATDLRKIILDAKKRKSRRRKQITPRISGNKNKQSYRRLPNMYGKNRR